MSLASKPLTDVGSAEPCGNFQTRKSKTRSGHKMKRQREKGKKKRTGKTQLYGERPNEERKEEGRANERTRQRGKHKKKRRKERKHVGNLSSELERDSEQESLSRPDSDENAALFPVVHSN